MSANSQLTSANMKWSKIKQTGDLPPSRSHFASAIGGNYFIIFGGSGKGEREKLNDAYLLDLGKHTTRLTD